MISCEVNGGDTSLNFRDASKVTEQGRYGSYTVKDYHLSRYACYLTVMNGDPRKPEIAAGQSYFACYQKAL